MRRIRPFPSPFAKRPFTSPICPFMSPACCSTYLRQAAYDGRFTGQLAPADPKPADRRHHRLQYDVVHDLAIAEALQRQPPEKILVLAALQCESEQSRSEIDQQEESVVESRLDQIVRAELL